LHEARNEKNEMYGMNAFISEIVENRNENGNDFLKNIISDLMMFKNSASVNDDIALLVVDIL